MITAQDVKLMADDTARAYRRAGFQVHTAAFDYSFDQATIAGGPTGVDAGPDIVLHTEVDRDSLFVWLASSISIRDHADPPNGQEEWLESVSLQIQDRQSGYRVLGPDRLLPHQGIAGQDGAPFVLGFPYVFAPGSRIAAIFGDQRDTRVRLTLHGVKLYTEPYTRAVILPDVPELEEP